MNSLNLPQIVKILQSGEIIAYPTEAVFGLGCDPLHKSAVTKILDLKQRSVSKGLILIAASWEQIRPFTKPIPAARLQEILKTWPGPNTWLFPAAATAPAWISGSHSSIALRVTAHPVAAQICTSFGGAIVSTSANLEGQPPARTTTAVQQQFPIGIDYIVPGEVGNSAKPTPIQDALTGTLIRP